MTTNSGSGVFADDAVLSGGPVYTNGPVGSAAPDLDGVDDKVLVNYTLPNQGSIALRYYPEPWYNYQSMFQNGQNRP